MYQVDLCYTDNPLCLWIFYLVNIIPSSSKSLQAPSTKTHSFLRKSTAKVFHSKQLALRCLVRWGPLNPTSRWALGATSLIILRRTTSSLMTKKKPKRKLRLNFAPIGAVGMIPIHHSMKIIQASFREWDHPFPRLPHSRELSKSRRFILIRISIARLSRLCTERANPLLHQSSFTKTLVERLYSSVLLI